VIADSFLTGSLLTLLIPVALVVVVAICWTALLRKDK
jgi:hypothetical protein